VGKPKTFREQEVVVRITTVLRKLVSVTGLFVTGFAFTEDGLVVDVRPRWRRPRCGHCGRIAPGYDRLPARHWRHLTLGRLILWLRYGPRRVACTACGVKSEAVPWAEPESRFTGDFEELTAYLAQITDQSAVARLLQIDWRTVGTIVRRVVARRLDPERLRGLRRIGIDEFSYRKRHQYLTVVVDHDRQRVVWAGEGRSGQALRQFFTLLGSEAAAALETVTMDMAAGYEKVVRELAPQAEVVFDRFHVQKLASEALDELRRQVVRDVGGAEAGRAVKRSRWALLKNPWNLTLHQRQKLAEIQVTNRPLYRGYLLKESLAAALDYRQPKRAREALTAWLAWASRSRLAPFQRVARTIRDHLEGILAYIGERLTNGLVEGTNGKIRMVARRAYGFHSAPALIGMIYLCCGGITLEPPLPQPTTLP
jgi:transposase